MKKKILFVEPFTGSCAGAQKVTLNVIKFLNNKFNISLIKRKADSQYDSELIGYHVGGFFPCESLLKRVYGTGDFFKNLSIMKFLIFVFTLVSCNFYTLFKALRLKPNYIYTYDPRGLFLGCLFLRITGFKVIWHLHSDLPKNKLLKGFMMLFCNEIIVPSKAISNSLGCYSKVKVMYNGFELPRPKYEKAKSASKKVLFLGTHHPHKGVHNLLRAIVLLDKSGACSDIILNVFGDFDLATPEYKKVIENELKQIKTSKVVFKGWTNNAVNEIFFSDLLVFPSIIEQDLKLGDELKTIRSSEALPTVLIESLAMGVPVVATDAPGVSEIVGSKSDGIIINESTPSEIAKAIELILFDLEKYKPDYKLVSEKFSLSSMHKTLENIFI